jgi:hypothetical protein
MGTAGFSSMTRDGLADVSKAKKESGPWPTQAVPSFKSLTSKVVVIASRRLGLFAFAKSINCCADRFSAPRDEATATNRKMENFQIRSTL